MEIHRSPIVPFAWIHVCITWSEIWGLKYYENGRLIKEQVNFNWIESVHQYDSVLIGKAAAHNMHHKLFALQMSELLFWYDFLSASEVKETLILSG